MNDHTTGVPSTAAIDGHPFHPMLVFFPIAFLITAFFTDLIARRRGDPFWARTSLWLTGAGAVTAAIAAIPWAIDFFTIPRAREHVDGWIHALGNVTVLVLATVSFFLRRRAAPGAVPTPAFALAGVVAALLVVTGWYGGELTYRHLIGVTGHAPEDHGAAEPAHEERYPSDVEPGGETPSPGAQPSPDDHAHPEGEDHTH